MMKLLLGGSPCTHWSIAQTKNRETLPEGLGWELFRNYLIAREKYQPDYFLYENNKSMAAARVGCSSIKQMKESNKVELAGTREEIIAMGYEPCKKCAP